MSKSVNKNLIVISASSDIGAAICRNWKAGGWDVFGTYRRESRATVELTAQGVKLIHSDLLQPGSVNEASAKLAKLCPRWDVLILCPGLQDPVGPFSSCDFNAWEDSVRVNFTSQMRFVRNLLSSRNKDSKKGPCVIFFAGGGTNSAPPNYSAYISSKIALIKMCELLDSEVKDSRFVIIGPGWVKTKIHQSTLCAKEKAGENFKRTVEKLSGNDCTPMEKVLECCQRLIDAPKEAISGRNFSVVFDNWKDDELMQELIQSPDMYKLRRSGNKK